MKGNCKGCNFVLECGCGCHAMSLAATGSLRADPFCYRSLKNKLINEDTKAF